MKRIAGVAAAAVVLLTVVAMRAESSPTLAGAIRRPPPSSMAALGDSITVAYNACGRFEDCPERSWSTGTNESVNSQYLRLLAINPAIKDHAFNFARSGASADDLAGQAEQAVAAGVQYVTILIGANDVCRDSENDMTRPTEFRRSVDGALAELRDGLPGVRVFISSIPDVYRLWEVEHDDLLARIVWRIGGVCQSMLDAPTSDSTASIARRNRVLNRVVSLNEQLREACAAFGPDCRFDDEAVFEHRFSGGAVSSWDHFHPSEDGQAALAELTAAAGFDWR